jgi:FkbM family methyltransferase
VTRLDRYANISYSQEGEDRILQRVFELQSSGFYIDVGAYHPKRLSNTYLFYKRGWKGINIDATPGSMEKFKKSRPRDINIERAITNKQKELVFFMFDEPALNSFDRELSLQRSKHTNYILLGEKIIQTSTLNEVLTEFLSEDQRIDFLTVDVEGFDLDVLQSNDWGRFRPAYILVECLSEESDIDKIKQQDVYQFLSFQEYRFFAKTFRTLFFTSNRIQ